MSAAARLAELRRGRAQREPGRTAEDRKAGAAIERPAPALTREGTRDARVAS